jgi:hypothetical protein
MTATEIQKRAAIVRRLRIPAPLIKTFTWYRELNENERVEVEERLALCVGTGPVVAEAYVQVREILCGE